MRVFQTLRAEEAKRYLPPFSLLKEGLDSPNDYAILAP
jgi:hypothetical protein